MTQTLRLAMLVAIIGLTACSTWHNGSVSTPTKDGDFIVGATDVGGGGVSAGIWLLKDGKLTEVKIEKE